MLVERDMVGPCYNENEILISGEKKRETDHRMTQVEALILGGKSRLNDYDNWKWLEGEPGLPNLLGKCGSTGNEYFAPTTPDRIKEWIRFES